MVNNLLQDQDGDKFYIILNGEVEGLLEPSLDLETLKSQFIMKKIFDLKEGQAFGELAILNTIKRTCSIRARGTVALLSLSRDVFLRVCGSMISKNVQNKVDFLKETETFQNLEISQIRRVASCFEFTKYPGNTQIIDQGASIQTVYIIVSGMVSCRRKVQKSSVNIEKVNKTIKRDIWNSLPDEFPIEFEVLCQKGTIICGDQMLNDKKSPYEVVVDLPVTFYECSLYEFTRYLGMENINQLTYPRQNSVDDFDLILRYMQSQAWSLYRSLYVRSCVPQKKNVEILKPSSEMLLKKERGEARLKDQNRPFFCGQNKKMKDYLVKTYQRSDHKSASISNQRKRWQKVRMENKMVKIPFNNLNTCRVSPSNVRGVVVDSGVRHKVTRSLIPISSGITEFKVDDQEKEGLKNIGNSKNRRSWINTRKDKKSQTSSMVFSQIKRKKRSELKHLEEYEENHESKSGHNTPNKIDSVNLGHFPSSVRLDRQKQNKLRQSLDRGRLRRPKKRFNITSTRLKTSKKGGLANPFMNSSNPDKLEAYLKKEFSKYIKKMTSISQTQRGKSQRRAQNKTLLPSQLKMLKNIECTRNQLMKYYMNRR